MTDALSSKIASPLKPARSVDEEAVARLRTAGGVSLLAEVILPAVEASTFANPDWLAIEIQAIWFIFTVWLLCATWHPRFVNVWRPAVLIFAAALIISSGVISMKGASLAPFMFLLVLLPIGGICLPWEPSWQAGMSSLCVVAGLFFSTQFNWHDHLVISGFSAMIASVLGSHFVSAAMTAQRLSLDSYLQALGRSEAKFRKIFETSGSLIAIYATANGRIIDVNPAWEKALGRPRNEVIGRTPGEINLMADVGAFDRSIRALTVGNNVAQQDPVVLRCADGRELYCVHTWSILELNQQPCALVIGQDVTSRVRAEEELRRNREMMLNQERLKAVGELASGIAHDLNNSLNALTLRLELLRSDPKLFSAQDSLKLISRIVGDASATIGRLQDFARRRYDRPVETVDLTEIIRESVEIARSTLEERGALLGRTARIDLHLMRLPPVTGEPSELRQIFLNLLLNAQDAMPQGGTVTIHAAASGETVVVTVEDEGQGIAPEHLDHIFDPFFTTKGERGTGLGLSTAYGTMRRLGGKISAHNQPGSGAVFTLVFPVSHADGPGTVPDRSRASGPRRLMVIDDDLENLEAMAAALRLRGHEVVALSSGAEALQLLKLDTRGFDAIFCDLGMPQLDGWEVARRVKEGSPSPLLFYLVTGWAQEIAVDDPRRSLVDGIIAKPINPAVLDSLPEPVLRVRPSAA